MLVLSLKKFAALSTLAALVCPNAAIGLAQDQGPASVQTTAAPRIQYEEIAVPRQLQSSSRSVARPNEATGNAFPVSSTLTPLTPIKKSFEPSPPMPAQNTASPAGSSRSQNTSIPSASAPILTEAESIIQTRIEAPKFVNVNKPATIGISVSNEGKSNIDIVSLTAVLPPHVQLTSATPQPTSIEGQAITFQLSGVGARETRTLDLVVIPSERTPIDIATTVRTENHRRLLVAVRQPKLAIAIDGPQQTNMGETVKHEVVITNIGDGVATDVQLSTVFPNELIQIKASSEGRIPAIAPGESARVIYESQAIAAGPIALKSSAKSDDGAEPQLSSFDITVFEPKLQIAATGPKVNFVNRSGIYTIELENNGQVDVTDVEVSLAVPRGMKIKTISREAKVDSTKGILHWSFAKIGTGSSEQIKLMAVVTEEGSQVCDILVDSHETSEKQIQLATQVSTRADLGVQIKNISGPIQVGGQVTFEVEIANQGSRQAEDVNIQIDLPDSLQAVPADGQNMFQKENSIQFTEPQVAPGGKVIFKFSAVGKTSGEHVVRSVTRIEGSERQMVSEDSVLVYDVDEARVSESLTPNVSRR